MMAKTRARTANPPSKPRSSIRRNVMVAHFFHGGYSENGQRRVELRNLLPHRGQQGNGVARCFDHHRQVPGFHVRTPLRIYKRIFSLLFSSVAVVITSPLMALAAVAIRLDSSGPIIFRQKRVGEFGVPFTVYKFRTMYDNAASLPWAPDEEDYSSPNHIGTPARHDDPRITRVGRWLRRTRLDELPQLFNVVRGDMSFVGPRPVPPHEEEECAAIIPFYKERWLIKPGATGWAQINRGYNATIEDHKDKLAYDLFYIKNVSIGLDIYIIFATLKILLLGRGGR